MFFELTEEQRFIKNTAKKFAEEKIAPVQEEDEKRCFSP